MLELLTTVRGYLPKLTEWRNEGVAWLGIVATIAAQVAVALDGVDVASVDAWVAFVPAAVGIVARNVAYGRETGRSLEAQVADLAADRDRLRAELEGGA